ncbi:baseplate J/gp47 family protein [Enterococcus lactis]|uniref:baseplate J/gp47 family protein n=1 Tax=Enterococcus lactis TaxID=357441 RepID=UPI0039A60552
MNPDEIGKYLETYDFDYFMNAALEQVPEGIDTREGSIIYDALAPACYQLADFNMQLKNVLLDTFTQTATGEYLDYRAEEHGLKRIAATVSVAKGKFTGDEGFQLVEGNRFSTIGTEPVYFSVVSDLGSGYYTLICETAGTRGNEYLGDLLPVDHINGLESSTLVEITIPARDEESDDDLRQRILRSNQVVSFGGNIEDYINLTSAIDGVGGCQIYPTWNGGGTVRIVIVSNEFGIPTTSLINQVQAVIDPPEGPQYGYGLAPIGHLVTVAAPTPKTIDVSLHVDIEVGASLSDVQNQIRATLAQHFLNLRKSWSNHNDLYQYGQTVYRSQIVAQIIKIEGVANVSNVRLNGADADVKLQLDNTKQEIAVLGQVTFT